MGKAGTIQDAGRSFALLVWRDLPDRAVGASAGGGCAIQVPARPHLHIPEIIPHTPGILPDEVNQVLFLIRRCQFKNSTPIGEIIGGRITATHRALSGIDRSCSIGCQAMKEVVTWTQYAPLTIIKPSIVKEGYLPLAIRR